MVKFVVKLPTGTNQLVDVPPTATAHEVRAAAGYAGQGFALAFNAEVLGDGAPISRFSELSTFGIVATAAPPSGGAPSGAECTICLEPLGSGAADAPVQALQCGHRFHAVCTQEWSRHVRAGRGTHSAAIVRTFSVHCSQRTARCAAAQWLPRVRPPASPPPRWSSFLPPLP